MPNESGAMFDVFVEGGLIDDADVVLSAVRFCRWDYNGTQSPVLALNVKMVDDEAKAHDQYLSCGDLKFFVPSDDGKKAIPVGNQQKLNLNTNAVQFIISIMNADTRGQLAAKLRSGDDISVLEGTKVHVVRKAQPKRAGIIQAQASDAPNQGRERTSLLVEKIIAYPGEAGAGSSAGSGVGAGAAKSGNGSVGAGTGAGSDTETKAIGVMLAVLASNGGQLGKAMIAGKAFNDEGMKAEEAPVRNAILGMIVRPEFLAAQGRPWTFDAASGIVKLG